MRSAVQRKLDRANAPSTEDTDVTRWINQAIREVICARHNWPSMDARYSITTTADKAQYALPNRNDIKDVNLIMLKDSSSGSTYKPLDEITGRQAMYAYGDGEPSGRPEAWMRFGKGIRLKPAPDVSTYSLRAVVWEYPAELINDDDTNDFTNYHTRLVETWAVSFGLEFYFDMERAVAMRGIAEAELAEAIKQSKVAAQPSHQSITPSRAAGRPAAPTRAGVLRRGRLG